MTAVLVVHFLVRDADPALTDPDALAAYFVDPQADDPVPYILNAEWSAE